jgi:hypothetical protein
LNPEDQTERERLNDTTGTKRASLADLSDNEAKSYEMLTKWRCKGITASLVPFYPRQTTGLEIPPQPPLLKD